jgi:hypothetical protein
MEESHLKILHRKTFVFIVEGYNLWSFNAIVAFFLAAG